MIFYDKLLDRYSVHQYELTEISRNSQFISGLTPVITHSSDLIKSEGIDSVIKHFESLKFPNVFRKYHISMTRIIRPLGDINLRSLNNRAEIPETDTEEVRVRIAGGDPGRRDHSVEQIEEKRSSDE